MRRKRGAPLAHLSIVVVWGLGGCAAPVERFDPRFVSRSEVLAVSYTRAGLSFLEQRRFGDAEANFRQALSLYPAAGNVRRNLGVALLGGGRFEESEGVFREILEREGESVAVRLSLGEALVGQGRLDAADKEYARAAALAHAHNDGRGESIAVLARADIAFQQGAEDEAVCLAREAHRVRADGETAGRLARFLVAVNRPTEVPAVVDPAIAGGPPDPRLLAVRGVAAFALGERSAAHGYAIQGLPGAGSVGGGLAAELRALAQVSGDSGSAYPEVAAIPEPRILALPPEFLRSLCDGAGCALPGSVKGLSR